MQAGGKGTRPPSRPFNEIVWEEYTSMHGQQFGRMALLCASLMWGSSLFVMKHAVDGIPVFLLLAIRFTMGLALLAAVFCKRLKKMTGRVAVHGIMAGILLCGAYSVQTFGLTGTTPGKNAFLTAVYCVLVPFVHWAVDRKKPTGWNFLAAGMCLAGIGLVSLAGGEMTLQWGDGLTLVSGVIYALHIVFLSRFGQEDDPILLTVVQFATVAALCWGIGLCTEKMPAALPEGVWLERGFLGIFATGIAILCQTVGQSVTPAAHSSILLSLESVFGVLFSVIFYHEQVTGQLLAGFALIFLAVLASETQFAFLRPRRKELADAPKNETCAK